MSASTETTTRDKEGEGGGEGSAAAAAVTADAHDHHEPFVVHHDEHMTSGSPFDACRTVESIVTGWCLPFKAVQKVYLGVCSGPDVVKAMELWGGEFLDMGCGTHMIALYASSKADCVTMVRAHVERFLTKNGCNHACMPNDGRGVWSLGKMEKYYLFAALRPCA